MNQLDAIVSPIKEEFAQFQNMYSGILNTDNPLLQEVLQYVVQRKGKQMRPMLTFLFARLYGKVTDATYNAALSLELLHTASLLHDDVLDESIVRRGRPSVPAMFGSNVAVLSGDYLLATSLFYMSLVRNVEMGLIISRLAQDLADGELLQQHYCFTTQTTEEVYFSIIKKKTASLFSACARLGAMSVGASSEQAEKAALFGELVGCCFQIRDDIFDYFNSSEIGKPTGNDLREGKLTLPLIHALEKQGVKNLRKMVEELPAAENFDENVKKLTEFAVSHGGIEYAESTMAKLRKDALAVLPTDADADVLAALSAYLDGVVNRTK